MTQGPSFLYFLYYDGKFYYRDQYGNILLKSDPVALDYTPSGWQEISILTELNKTYFGFERSFTIPLNFVEDGGDILKKIYYGQGIEGKMNLQIAEQKLYIESDVITGSYYFFYDHLYNGEVDFSTFNHSGPLVTANVIEGGLAKLIKANENTVYEIPVPEDITIKMDGLELQASSTFVTVNEVHQATPASLNWLLWSTVAFVNNDGTVFDTEQQSTSILPKKWNSNTDYDDNRYTDNWFFKAGSPITVRFKRRVQIKLRNVSRHRYYIKNSNGTRYLLSETIGNNNPSGQIIDIDKNVDVSIPMAAGETLYLISEVNSQVLNPNVASAEIFEDDISVTYTSRYKTTYIHGVTPLYLFQQLISKITNGKYSATSDLLEASSALIITCGDAIRGLAGAKIKISLAQFFNSMNCQLNISLSIRNNTAIIEPKGDQFEGGIIDLGEVSDLKTSPATEFIYNTIKVGYQNQDYDNVNGRDEFNNALQSTTDITRVVKELSLVSDIRGDSYGIEFTRINLEGKKTTDSSADNDNFFIMTDGAGNLDRSLNPTATGLISPSSVFNLAITPKRMLLKHGWFIRSFMHRLDGTLIKFQTTEKNSTLVAGGIAETADVLVGNLAPRKFIPTLFEFETQVPEDYQRQLDDNPIRRYRFMYNGISMTGIALKSGIEPSSRKAQVFQLLADATCDLNLLQDIYE